MPQLVSKYEASDVDEQVSETVIYVYSDKDVPVPVQNRNTLTHMNRSQPPEYI